MSGRSFTLTGNKGTSLGGPPYEIIWTNAQYWTLDQYYYYCLHGLGLNYKGEKLFLCLYYNNIPTKS